MKKMMEKRKKRIEKTKKTKQLKNDFLKKSEKRKF